MTTYEELESSDAPFEIDSNGVKLFMENLTYSYPVNKASIKKGSFWSEDFARKMYILKPLWIGYLSTCFGIDHNIEFTNFVFGYKHYRDCRDIVILNYPGMKTEGMNTCGCDCDAQIV